MPLYSCYKKILCLFVRKFFTVNFLAVLRETNGEDVTVILDDLRSQFFLSNCLFALMPLYIQLL
jgi:hypothetical protein